MSARRLRSSVYNNHGSQGCKSGGAWDNADSRSFPRFQPMEAGGRRSEDCPPRGKQMPAPVIACTRPHTTKLQAGSEARQVCCSAHPNVLSCCSARPPIVVSERRPGGSKGRTAYPLPAPLGKYAGTKPLASLTSIYKVPVDDCDVDEENGWEEGEDRAEERAEEGNVVEITASHSCPISSASPEPRPCCCRRQQTSPTPLQLQVLLRDTQPTNTHHQAEKPSRRTSKERKPAHRSSFGQLLHRKRSKTRASRSESSQSEPLPQPQLQLQPQPPPQPPQPQEKQRRRHQFVAAELEQAPTPRQQVTPPVYQPRRQQPQRQQQPRQYMHCQRNQHQMQYPSVVLDHSRTRSMPILNDESIYSSYNSDNEEFFISEQTSQLYEKENVPQHQHIFRRPFTGLMRSQDSIEYRR